MARSSSRTPPQSIGSYLNQGGWVGASLATADLQSQIKMMTGDDKARLLGLTIRSLRTDYQTWQSNIFIQLSKNSCSFFAAIVCNACSGKKTTLL